MPATTALAGAPAMVGGRSTAAGVVDAGGAAGAGGVVVAVGGGDGLCCCGSAAVPPPPPQAANTAHKLAMARNRDVVCEFVKPGRRARICLLDAIPESQMGGHSALPGTRISSATGREEAKATPGDDTPTTGRRSLAFGNPATMERSP